MKKNRLLQIIFIFGSVFWAVQCSNMPNSGDKFADLIEETKNIDQTLTPPGQIVADSITHCSVSLSWESVEEASRYSVYRSDNAGYGYAKVGETDSTAIDISDITPGRNNFFIIKTVGSGGSVSYGSEEVLVSVPVSTPGELLVYNMGEGQTNGVCILGADCYYEWQNVAGCVSGPVSLEIYDSSENLVTTIDQESANDGSERFTLPCDAGLVDGNTYTARVTSSDGSEKAEYDFVVNDWGFCGGLD